MKRYARMALSCLLAAVLTVPLLACGASEADKGPKKDMSAATREQLADLAKSDERLTGELENKTIKWLSTWDINSDDTGKTTPVELAIFQERYGGKIEWHQTTHSARYNDLANAINSDEGIDFFYAGDWDAFPKGAVRGMFVPYDDYLDLDSELWADVKDANDSMIWDGKHYVAAVEVTGDNCAIIYNRKTIDENGLDDPAELFEKGKWDWDAFQDMLSEFVDTSNEHYGIDSWYFEAGLSASTGVPYIGLEDGKLVNNLRNEAIEDYQNWMYDLWQSDYIALGVGDYGWTSRDYYIGEDVFFVPVPKYEKADEYYIPASINAYCFVKGGHNPEGVAKFLDCFRFSKVCEGAQEISDQQFIDDYEWTDEMIEMKNKMNEMALENHSFDFYNGISADVTSVLDSSEHGVRAASRGVPWSESVNSIYDQVQNYIDEINGK